MGDQRPQPPLPASELRSAGSRTATSRKPINPAADEPFRVMVVDDSAVIRGLIIKMLETDAQIRVYESVANGAVAVDRLARAGDVEVIILDIEMPVMNGLTALSKLLAIDPTVQVVMASTLTQHNAEISLRALEKGAADYIPKPSSRQMGGSGEFQRDLLAKVKALAARRRALGGALTPAAPAFPAATKSSRIETTDPPPPGARRLQTAPRAAGMPPITLRPMMQFRPEIIAVGSSTGGPQALIAMLTALMAGAPRQPVLVTQHMPPTFTTILGEHLQRSTGVRCAEAVDDEPVSGGRIYVAPGDHHMLVQAAPAGKRIKLSRDPPENFCRPSVDPMLRSLVRCYGRGTLAVILTGMGSDGLDGCRQVVEAGGAVIAQDQATSVVWGMPGAVATAGLCCAVEPLSRIAGTVQALIGRGNVR
jgi:two-component system, chemotaxis family, protein-glutamate methylesterase/glutaminase